MTATHAHPADCRICVALRTAPLLEDVADRFGMRVVNVRRHANRHGVPLDRFAVCWTCLEIRWALDYAAAATVGELAARVGLSEEALRRHLARSGITIPTRLEQVPA